jgi:chloride channel 7
MVLVDSSVNSHSGLFVPTLYAGAGLGRTIGHFVHSFDIGMDFVDPGTYALIGAAAVLGGMARMTISLAVILVEATGNIQYGLPIMATLMTAKWVGDYFNHGLYEIHVHLSGWQFLDFAPPKIANYLLVMDIMSNDPIYTLEVENVGRLYDMLKSCKHQGFPVLSLEYEHGAPPQFRGLILRRHLVIMLKNRALFRAQPIPYETAPILDNEDLEKLYPRYATIDDVVLQPGDRDAFVDLTPYMNAGPFVIQEHSPATHAFRLFRTMGLRHLPVVNKENNIVGMVTRKDLTSVRFKRQLRQIVGKENRGFDTEITEVLQLIPSPDH